MFHPQIIAKPGNMMLLDRLIKYIKKHPNVWIARSEDIAHHWNTL
jgi:peptidoglycan/xylan/chitin deacetylase (PgdA/CDA1 family)